MEDFIGTIKLFGGNFAPRGWAMCNGQLLPISQNSALYAILGTIYGGDGVNTFGLPNLQGRIPLGMGQGQSSTKYTQGQTGGTEQTSLTIDQMPAHNHVAVLQASSANSTLTAPAAGSSLSTPGGYVGRTFTATYGYNTSTPDVALNSTTVTNALTGKNAPIPNLQPYMAMNYIICLSGVFPSRD